MSFHSSKEPGKRNMANSINYALYCYWRYDTIVLEIVRRNRFKQEYRSTHYVWLFIATFWRTVAVLSSSPGLQRMKYLKGNNVHKDQPVTQKMLTLTSKKLLQ